MVHLKTGNLLEDGAEALVNTVNTVGVMGKGVALQFRNAFPENFRQYQQACRRGEIVPGKMFVFGTGRLQPRWIVNFPTKRHWREKSRIEDIQSGLIDLTNVIRELRIRSIAIPPLGCGNGGLDWAEVRPRIQQAMANVPEVDIRLYEPAGSPAAGTMAIHTTKPKLTPSRAALLAILDRYTQVEFSFSKLAAQKLAYFLQAAGEPLKLEFVAHQYGPYAESLNHVLQRLEGHYLRGYGDRTIPGEMRLTPGTDDDVAGYLFSYPATMDRVERIVRLVEGFESPYGLELLASVHFLAERDPDVALDPERAIEGVQAWSDRKRQQFPAKHIRIAWQRLHDHDWLRPIATPERTTSVVAQAH